MTKEIFIDLVFQKIYAGRPTADFSVLKSDIEAYLPAACNYALMHGYYDQQSAEHNRDIPTTFYHYYGDLPLEADTRKYPFFLLPKKIVAMPSNRGLRKVMDMQDRVYAPIGDTQMSNVDYWCKIMSDEVYYRIEQNKVFIYNKPAGLDKFAILALIEVSDLADTDELYITAGLEKEAIDICFEFVTGIRQLQADAENDGNDINRR